MQIDGLEDLVEKVDLEGTSHVVVVRPEDVHRCFANGATHALVAVFGAHPAFEHDLWDLSVIYRPGCQVQLSPLTQKKD